MIELLYDEKASSKHYYSTLTLDFGVNPAERYEDSN